MWERADLFEGRGRGGSREPDTAGRTETREIIVKPWEELESKAPAEVGLGKETCRKAGRRKAAGSAAPGDW